MSSLMVAVLLVLGCLLLTSARRRRVRGSSLRPHGRILRSKPDPWALPLLVYQLAALLEAGRAPQRLWHEVRRAHAPPEMSGGNGRSAPVEWEILEVLTAAERAAALGHSVVPVLRRYGREQAAGGNRRRASSASDFRRVWLDLANCWDVAEISGAPLAKLLNRYAVSLEAELDAEAARITALAGPRATVKLLGWLPLFGLALGMLMGVDPVAVLLGTPIGRGALILGVALMIGGRRWSHAMVASAERNR